MLHFIFKYTVCNNVYVHIHFIKQYKTHKYSRYAVCSIADGDETHLTSDMLYTNALLLLFVFNIVPGTPWKAVLALSGLSWQNKVNWMCDMLL